jgi:hypothetical protein
LDLLSAPLTLDDSDINPPQPTAWQAQFLKVIADQCPKPNSSMLMPMHLQDATNTVKDACVRRGWLEEHRCEGFFRVWTLTNDGRQAIGLMLH